MKENVKKFTKEEISNLIMDSKLVPWSDFEPDSNHLITKEEKSFFDAVLEKFSNSDTPPVLWGISGPRKKTVDDIPYSFSLISEMLSVGYQENLELLAYVVELLMSKNHDTGKYENWFCEYVPFSDESREKYGITQDCVILRGCNTDSYLISSDKEINDFFNVIEDIYAYYADDEMYYEGRETFLGLWTHRFRVTETYFEYIEEGKSIIYFLNKKSALAYLLEHKEEFPDGEVYSFVPTVKYRDSDYYLRYYNFISFLKDIGEPVLVRELSGKNNIVNVSMIESVGGIVEFSVYPMITKYTPICTRHTPNERVVTEYDTFEAALLELSHSVTYGQEEGIKIAKDYEDSFPFH